MERLKELRKCAGLTQWQLARAARVDRSRLALAEVNQVRLSEQQAARVRRVLDRAIEKRRAELNRLTAQTNAQPANELVAASA